MILVFFLISVGLITFLPMQDTDFGWHYQCGKLIIEKSELCLKNSFTYYLANYEWANPNFIYDFFIAKIYNQFGFVGISVFGALVFMLIALVLWQLYKTKPLIKIISIYLLFLLPSWSIFQLGMRSQILSILFFSITLLLADQLRSAQKLTRQLQLVLLLAILFIIWSNTHPSLFLGPLIILFLTIDQLIKKNFFYLIYLLILFIVTWLNPFSYKVYLEAWNHFLTPMNQLIAEWVAPVYWQQILILLLALLYIWLLIKKYNHSRVNIYYLLLLGTFSAFAMMARRNLPLFYLTYLYIFINTFKPVLNISKDQTKFMTLALIISGLLIGILQLANNVHLINFQGYCNNSLSKLPCKATNKLKPLANQNIFNNYEWGGFLIWQLPQHRFFVDGRMPAWQTKNGISPYSQYLEIIQAKPGWNQTLRHYHTNTLLIGNGTFLDLVLHTQSKKFGWKEIYRDSVAVIYKTT